jgi:outer membrane biogenesis lipoprotein LolB
MQLDTSALMNQYHFILPLLCIILLTACAPVQPWERGNLAKPQMALDPYPLQSALRAHNYGSREAAAGGNAAQGGGCGCY